MQDRTCARPAPFCCGTPGGVLSCSSNAAACDGFAKPAQCPDERPIACSVGDDALCCSESKPYCCSNSECYATASECAANVAELCLESDFRARRSAPSHRAPPSATMTRAVSPNLGSKAAQYSPAASTSRFAPTRWAGFDRPASHRRMRISADTTATCERES
jgi:hypothetical protein